jgi:hypothetical protein
LNDQAAWCRLAPRAPLVREIRRHLDCAREERLREEGEDETEIGEERWQREAAPQAERQGEERGSEQKDDELHRGVSWRRSREPASAAKAQGQDSLRRAITTV